MLKLETLWEEEWNKLDANDTEGSLKVALIATMVDVEFSGGLRGEEVCKMDLSESRKPLEDSLHHPRKPHVTVALLGKVKGEMQSQCHFLPIALTLYSGIQTGKWVHCVVHMYAKKNVFKGPVFWTTKGRRIVQAKTADFNPAFRDFLRGVQERWPAVLSPSVHLEAEYSLR
jgi:hypothetical protein